MHLAKRASHGQLLLLSLQFAFLLLIVSCDTIGPMTKPFGGILSSSIKVTQHQQQISLFLRGKSKFVITSSHDKFEKSPPPPPTPPPGSVLERRARTKPEVASKMKKTKIQPNLSASRRPSFGRHPRGTGGDDFELLDSSRSQNLAPTNSSQSPASGGPNATGSSSPDPTLKAIAAAEAVAQQSADLLAGMNFGTVLELNAVQAANLNLWRHTASASVILTIAYTIVFIVGIVGNSFVVAIVCKSPRMRTVTNYFIANLAFADILVLLFCLPATLVGNLFVPYVLGLFVCKTVSYLQGVAVSASINTMVAVTMDRFLAICFPMDWHMSRRMARWTIACIWLFSLTISMPWAVYFTLVPVNYSNMNIYVCAEDWPSERIGNYYFVFANLILCYLLPATVIILCYLGIWYKIERRNIPGDRPKGLKIELIMQKSKLKVVKMMMIVVVIFLLSWLPLYLMFARLKLAEERAEWEEKLIPWLMPLAQWLGASNSCINPILYTFFNRKYKRGFIDLLRFGLCCGQGGNQGATSIAGAASSGTRVAIANALCANKHNRRAHGNGLAIKMDTFDSQQGNGCTSTNTSNNKNLTSSSGNQQQRARNARNKYNFSNNDLDTTTNINGESTGSLLLLGKCYAGPNGRAPSATEVTTETLLPAGGGLPRSSGPTIDHAGLSLLGANCSSSATWLSSALAETRTAGGGDGPTRQARNASDGRQKQATAGGRRCSVTVTEVGRGISAAATAEEPPRRDGRRQSTPEPAKTGPGHRRQPRCGGGLERPRRAAARGARDGKARRSGTGANETGTNADSRPIDGKLNRFSNDTGTRSVKAATGDLCFVGRTSPPEAEVAARGRPEDFCSGRKRGERAKKERAPSCSTGGRSLKSNSTNTTRDTESTDLTGLSLTNGAASANHELKQQGSDNSLAADLIRTAPSVATTNATGAANESRLSHADTSQQQQQQPPTQPDRVSLDRNSVALEAQGAGAGLRKQSCPTSLSSQNYDDGEYEAGNGLCVEQETGGRQEQEEYDDNDDYDGEYNEEEDCELGDSEDESMSEEEVGLEDEEEADDGDEEKDSDDNLLFGSTNNSPDDEADNRRPERRDERTTLSPMASSLVASGSSLVNVVIHRLNQTGEKSWCQAARLELISVTDVDNYKSEIKTKVQQSSDHNKLGAKDGLAADTSDSNTTCNGEEAKLVDSHRDDYDYDGCSKMLDNVEYNTTAATTINSIQHPQVSRFIDSTASREDLNKVPKVTSDDDDDDGANGSHGRDVHLSGRVHHHGQDSGTKWPPDKQHQEQNQQTHIPALKSDHPSSAARKQPAGVFIHTNPISH